MQELDIAAESIYVDKQIRLVRQCNNVGGSGRVEGIGEDIVLPHPYAVSVLTQSIVPRLETFWVFVISRKNQLKDGKEEKIKKERGSRFQKEKIKRRGIKKGGKTRYGKASRLSTPKSEAVLRSIASLTRGHAGFNCLKIRRLPSSND